VFVASSMIIVGEPFVAVHTGSIVAKKALSYRIAKVTLDETTGARRAHAGQAIAGDPSGDRAALLPRSMLPCFNLRQNEAADF
jgi:hypothetical protein